MDRMSKEKRSKVMASIRSEDTRPEMELRRSLWERGLRYRVHYGKEKVDIAFPSKKVAVFVDGCFWHGCPEHSHQPKSNDGYWRPKLQKNKERDLAKEGRLEAEGWTVVRLWEHELSDISSAAQKVMQALRK
jgi:DNA mismatch endonuclease (patch repair protein)